METDLSDFELLTAFTQRRSQPAFAQLVARHANLVYGTARRQVGDLHLAEDVAQAVFVVLSRKAGQLNQKTILSGWLYTTTLYASANALKSQARRRHHEYKRGQMNPVIQPDQATDAPFESVAPLLDGALAKLARRDRDAVLLKFIEGKSHREVGAAIGVSEDAARKRIARSLQRLRGFFQKRGVALSVAGLCGILSTQVAQAAPASVLATTTSTAGAVTVAKGTLSMLAWAQAKLIASAVAAALLITGGGLTFRALHNRFTQAAAPRAVAPAAPLPIIPILDEAPAKPDAAKKTIEGVIIGTDGEPLPDAEVFLATPRAAVNLYTTTNNQRAPRVITEKDGKFSFPATSQVWVVVAMHQQGVAIAIAEDLAASSQVILKPWGRVEGTLYAATKPLAGESVSIAELGTSGDLLSECIVNQTRVKTDANGHFVFPKVPPGAPLLSHEKMIFWMQTNKWDCIEVKPGQTVKVDMGAIGRPVIGKVTVPPGWEKKLITQSDRTHMWEVEARFMAPLNPADPQGKNPRYLTGMLIPKGWENMTPRQQHLIQEKWDHSAEGIAYRRFMFPDQTTVVPGGTFRFDALRPGRYMLSIRALEHMRAQNMLEDVATARQDFVVPELPDAQKVSEQPLDIGSIEVKPAPRIVIGDIAPAFEAKSLEGKPVKLADFKGKYLLLHIHPVHYEQKELPGLSKAYNSHKNDPQFAMLTIHLHTEPAKAKEVAASHEWTWPQALGKIEFNGGIPEAYAASPAMIYLIDPAGKVITKILNPENADTEIAKAFLER